MLQTFRFGHDFGEDAGGNGVPFVNEKYLLFDGVDESVDMGDVLGFDGDEAFSAFAWIRPTATGHTVIAKRAQPGSQPGWSLEHLVLDKIEVEIRNAIANRIRVTFSTGITELQDGLWHHVGFTYDGSQAASGVAVYYDGLSKPLTIGNDTLTLSIANAGIMCIGARDKAARFFEGGIDEPTVHSKELSGAEVLALYNSGRALDPKALPSGATLQGWWRMGDGDTFNTILDKSGFARHGTMINMQAEDIAVGVP